MFMSQEAQKFLLLKPSWNPLWKFVSWKKSEVKVMKGKENYLQKNGKQFCKFYKTFRKLRCHLFKFRYIIDAIAIVRTHSHILDGVFALIVNTLLCLVCIGLYLWCLTAYTSEWGGWWVSLVLFWIICKFLFCCCCCLYVYRSFGGFFFIDKHRIVL